MSDRKIEPRVTIGDSEYTVQRFRGLKAILVIDSMTRIIEEIPDIVADVTKAYQARNTTTITEQMSKLPRWEGFSTEDFDAAERHSGKRAIELPTPISAREQFMVSLPKLLRGARTETLRLFALLIIPNEELKTADKGDTVNAALDKYSDLFLYEAELDELVEVAFAAQDAMGQLNPKSKERLGKMMRTLLSTIVEAVTGQPLSMQVPQQETETPPIPPTQTDGAPISSTDSPVPTDGTERPLSMASPGVS